MKRTEIAYIYDGGTYGGVETALVTLFGHLDQRYRPTLIVTWKRLHPQFALELTEAGVEILELPLDIITFSGRLKRQRVLFNYFRTRRPALLHIHSCLAISHRGAIAMARAYGARVLRTVHMPFGIPTNNGHVNKRLGRAIYRPFESAIARVIAVSEVDRRELEAVGLWGAGVLDTIPNGIKLERFSKLPSPAEAKRRLGLDPAELVIGAVGRICAQKGFARLIDAMPRVLARHPRARLAIVGSGNDLELHRAHAARVGLGDRAVFFGHRADVPSCLPAFDVLAMPSLYEAQGLVLLEGMAAGCASVASPLECFRESDGGTGATLLCDTADAGVFADALSGLLDDPARRTRMGAAGLKRAAEFSGQAFAGRHAALYEEVLAS